MTALDQAFIKAYRHQSAAPEATPTPRSERPVVSLSEAMAELAAAGPASRSAKVTVDSLLDAADRSSGAAASMFAPTPAVLLTRPTVSRSASAPRMTTSLAKETESLLADRPAAGQGTVPTPADEDKSRSPRWASSEPGLASFGLRASVAEAVRNPRGQEGNASNPQDAAMPAVAAWRPMLQVDHVLWPKMLERLEAVAASALDQLAESLAKIAAQGRKVVGLGSCSRGEGVTSLLLAAGRRLVDYGLRVALADANLPDPQLARQLGLLPQTGWDDAIAQDLALEDVAIESIADRLTVLPVREPFAGTGENLTDEDQMAHGLTLLEAAYDIVLVDLGALENRTTFSGSLARGIGRSLNAVVLVQNVRLTTPNQLTDIQRCLAAAGIFQAGVVENFVAA